MLKLSSLVRSFNRQADKYFTIVGYNYYKFKKKNLLLKAKS